MRILIQMQLSQFVHHIRSPHWHRSDRVPFCTMFQLKKLAFDTARQFTLVGNALQTCGVGSGVIWWIVFFSAANFPLHTLSRARSRCQPRLAAAALPTLVNRALAFEYVFTLRVIAGGHTCTVFDTAIKNYKGTLRCRLKHTLFIEFPHCILYL